MKVGILCAGDREFAPFLPMLERCRITERAMLRFHEGLIENVPAVALYSGVCKVNAAIAVQLLIDHFGCGAIINAGTAGGMTEDLRIFDTVVCTEAVYHDVAGHILTEFHPWLDAPSFKADRDLLNLAGMAAQRISGGRRIAFGRMATGEAFIEDGQRESICHRLAPLTVDMETAAIAHVCHVNRTPFIAVRTITDTPDHSGLTAFEQNCAEAAQLSAEFVRAMLQICDWRDLQ